MAGIDHSIYFQYKPADLFGAVVDGAKTGMDLKNQASQNQWQQSERERLQKENERKLQEQTWNDEMMKARNSSLVRGADGSVTLDNALYKNNLYNLTGSGNLLAGQQYQTLNQDILNQQAAEAKRQQDAQKFAGDQRLQNAQIGKLEAERRELLRKPTLPPEIKQNQATAAGFGRRLEQAESVFDDLAASGYDRGGFAEAIGSALPNFAQGSKSQQQEQAERNFINAVLRRESGAAISPSEFESAEKQYFPRFGDSPEVIAQKKANREQAGIALKAEAGRAWDQIPLAEKKSSELSQSPKTPTKGRVVDGYRFKGGDPSKPESWEKI